MKLAFRIMAQLLAFVIAWYASIYLPILLFMSGFVNLDQLLRGLHLLWYVFLFLNFAALAAGFVAMIATAESRDGRLEPRKDGLGLRILRNWEKMNMAFSLACLALSLMLFVSANAHMNGIAHDLRANHPR